MMAAQKLITRKASQFIALLFFLSSSGKVYAQYKMDYDRNHLSTLVYGSNHLNGFCAELSLTAMFTTGSEDRNGFRWGVSITLLQTVDNWELINLIHSINMKIDKIILLAQSKLIFGSKKCSLRKKTLPL
jgi:hypothetical protein